MEEWVTGTLCNQLVALGRGGWRSFLIRAVNIIKQKHPRPPEVCNKLVAHFWGTFYFLSKKTYENEYFVGLQLSNFRNLLAPCFFNETFKIFWFEFRNLCLFFWYVTIFFAYFGLNFVLNFLSLVIGVLQLFTMSLLV